MSDISTRLQALRGEGLSYSVAGRVSRLGLPKRERKPKTPKSQRKRPAEPSMKRIKRINPIAAAARFATLDDSTIPVEQRRTLETVRARDCHWIGDPRSANWFFCGAAAVEGKSFCGPHCARAWEVSR
jgi:hypothetical protein